MASGTHRLLLALAALGSLGGGAPPGAAQGATGLARPPNVLVIMTDQQHARSLGCYGNGFGGVQGSLTPNLDALAAGGARFENAHCVTPQCVPSRFAILTGRWPHDTGLRRNKVWEPRDQTTLTALARDAGYVTGTIGKHHFYWLDQSQPLSEDHGFDVIVDEEDYGAYCSAAGVPGWADLGNVWEMPGLPAGLRGGYTMNPGDFHPAGYFTDQALEFLEARAGPGGDGEPFVLFCSFVSPHTPVYPSGPADPMDWAHRYHPFDVLELPPNLQKVATTTRLQSRQGVYAAMTELHHKELLSYYYGLVSQIDWNVGRLLARLEQLGLDDETVVVFTSDHGEMASEMACWTKGTGAYEAVTRVPLIMRLPGVVAAGMVVSELTTNLDLFPTLLELTGFPATQAQRDALAGVGVTDLVVGVGAPPGWPAATFSEFGTPLDSIGRHQAVRTDSYKLVRHEVNGIEEEFYDLLLDPFEIDDRILDPAPGVQATIGSLRAQLAAWWNNEQGHAPFYRSAGRADAVPVRAAEPLPADGALDVAVDVDPEFLPSTAADAIDVCLGIDPASLVLFASLPPMAARFNPGTLAPSTTYYWRVDQTNDNGTTPGPVWSFTTAAGGGGGGDLAFAPSPADRASDVDVSSTLSWSVGPATRMQLLSFGREGDLRLVPALLIPGSTTHAPGPLDAGVRYAWRVDSYAAGVLTEGDVWTFTTSAAGLPGRASVDAPLHMADGVDPIGLELRWTAGTGGGTVSHAVHLGTDFPLELVAEQVGTSFAPPPLVLGQTYYWRVDEVNSSGTRRGFTWRFRTR